MKESISNTFKIQACMEEIRSNERQLEAAENAMAELQVSINQLLEETEAELEDEIVGSDDDSDNESVVSLVLRVRSNRFTIE